MMAAPSTQQDRNGTLRPQLRQLVDSRLVREVGPDEFAFRHTLTREAAYGSLLRQERRGLHQAVAETLAELFGPEPSDYFPDLAFHFAEAGAWDQALVYARLAGEQAQSQNAPHEAIGYFTRALEAADRLGTSLPPGLFRSRGQAYELLGDFNLARADLEAALAGARQAGDRRAEWQALLDLGFLWTANNYETSGGWLEQALELARGLDDPAVLATTLNRIGNWHFNLDQPELALKQHQEALGLFEALDDRAGLAETYDLLGLTTSESGRLREGGRYYDKALALFEALGDRRGQSSSLAIYAERGPIMGMSSYAAAGTLDESRRMAERACQLAREIGWRSGEAFALCILGACWLSEGDYGQALALVEQARALAEEIGHRQWLTFALVGQGLIYTDLFDLASGRQKLEEAMRLARETNSTIWLRFTTAFLAEISLMAGELEQAGRLLDADQTAITALSGMTQRAIWFERGQLAMARGQGQEALAIAEHLVASVPERRPEQIVPILWQLRGAARAALGQAAEAERDWEEALATARAQNLRPLVWRLEARLAQLFQTQGRTAEAALRLSSARDTVEAIARTIPDAKQREQYLRGAHAVLEGTNG